jgi:hypothetical protein
MGSSASAEPRAAAGGRPAPVVPPKPYRPTPGGPVRPPQPYRPSTPQPPVVPPRPYAPPQRPGTPPDPLHADDEHEDDRAADPGQAPQAY